MLHRNRDDRAPVRRARAGSVRAGSTPSCAAAGSSHTPAVPRSHTAARGVSPIGPTSRRPAHSAGTTFTRSAASRGAARSTSVRRSSSSRSASQDSRTQEAVGDGQVDRRLVALQPGEALEVLAFEPRVHAERRAARTQKNSRSAPIDETKVATNASESRPSSTPICRVPLHDGGVGERLGRSGCRRCAPRERSRARECRRWSGSQAHAPLFRGPARAQFIEQPALES